MVELGAPYDDMKMQAETVGNASKFQSYFQFASVPTNDSQQRRLFPQKAKNYSHVKVICCKITQEYTQNQLSFV